MINHFGADRIVVGLDAKRWHGCHSGWVETLGTSAIDLAQSLVNRGLRWIVHTDVSTDGIKGLILKHSGKSAAVPSCNIIASGGVSCSEDIINLRELSVECPNIEGVIVGKSPV